jgi:hypothetical protein
LKHVLKQPVLIDLRNIYRPEEMRSQGFVYDDRPARHDLDR